MVEKVKIPGFIKEGAKAAMEPLNKLENQIADTLKKVTEDRNLSKKELEKLLNDALGWVKKSYSEVEKSFNDGVTRTLSVLNLPTRDELAELEKKLSKLDKVVKSLESSMGGKKAKTATTKKPAVKKTKKPAVKKTAKKAVKKTTKKA